ncbi:MAG: Sapep family Mn(2+)-dependent dipeptidase, partial [Clostridia bacterium]
MKSYFEMMLDKTMQILAIDSVEASACESSPFGEGVGEVIEEVATTAQEMGFAVHNEGGYYCTCDIGEGETFGILGHLDVVPYENNWSASPLGQIVDDKIYGRGILDDKGPMMCCLYACKELLDSGKKPTKKIRFIFGGNEESGWRCIDKYNEVDVMPKIGFSPDGDFPVINCEKGLVHYELLYAMPQGMTKLEGGTRANIVMENCVAELDREITLPCYDDALTVSVEKGKTIIKAIGKPAHASTPQLGDNALWHILHYLADAIGGDYVEFERILCHNDGKNVGINLHDSKSGNLT